MVRTRPLGRKIQRVLANAPGTGNRRGGRRQTSVSPPGPASAGRRSGILRRGGLEPSKRREADAFDQSCRGGRRLNPVRNVAVGGDTGGGTSGPRRLQSRPPG